MYLKIIMLYLKIGKDSVTTSRKFVKLYVHFHPPCVLHPGSAYTTCSSAVPHFQIEGERERRVSAPFHFVPHFLSLGLFALLSPRSHRFCDFSHPTSWITHTPATQLDPVVINGISDEVSDFLRRRAPKSPPSSWFFPRHFLVCSCFCGFHHRAHPLGIPRRLSGARCRSADLDTLQSCPHSSVHGPQLAGGSAPACGARGRGRCQGHRPPGRRGPKIPGCANDFVLVWHPLLPSSPLV